MMVWKDPRTPVSITKIGKFTVTIYDIEAYNESLRLYPDDPNEAKVHVVKANKVPPFAKQKPAVRWNWTHKLEQPLEGKVS